MAVLTYKCPNCDGGLKFDPVSQKFTCEYCASSFTEEVLNNLNPASSDDSKVEEQENSTSQAEQGNLLGYTCPSCGAEVVTDETTAATSCYYCHNPIVLSGRLDGRYLPNKIVPFAITKEQAIEKFMEWSSKKWFVPKWFFSKKQIDTLTGIYFPHWIVDTDTTTSMNTEGTIVRTWTSGDSRYTNTKYYQVIRDGEVHLEDVTRTALKKANKKIVDGVHPFSEQKLVDFNMGYLSGFQAEKRDIEREELEADVTREIFSLSARLTANTATEYGGVSSNDVAVNIRSTDWSYVLYPVWTITYKSANGEFYYYALNGDSGKICGRLPVDFKKLALLFAGITVPLMGIAALIGGIFR